MRILLSYQDHTYEADLAKPLDVSIPLREGTDGVNCFYAPLMEMTPVVAGDFVGSTEKGGLVNFFNVKLNPHGNGTHTECVGHISKEKYTINDNLKKYHYIAKLVSVYPTKLENGDRVILKDQIVPLFSNGEAEALLIRTLPNSEQKLSFNYSGTNPPYIDPAAITYLVDCGLQHLLVDLPSVDKEEDGGALSAHKAFWHYPDRPRKKSTISELIFVNNEINDGLFLLNIQVASFELDVSPSKPILYDLKLTE